jgi:hypothetical protein
MGCTIFAFIFVLFYGWVLLLLRFLEIVKGPYFLFHPKKNFYLNCPSRAMPHEHHVRMLILLTNTILGEVFGISHPNPGQIQGYALWKNDGSSARSNPVTV